MIFLAIRGGGVTELGMSRENTALYNLGSRVCSGGKEYGLGSKAGLDG